MTENEKDLRAEVDAEIAAHIETVRLLVEAARYLAQVHRNAETGLDEVTARRALALAMRSVARAAATGLARLEPEERGADV